jgi:hypothetical protein
MKSTIGVYNPDVSFMVLRTAFLCQSPDWRGSTGNSHSLGSAMIGSQVNRRLAAAARSFLRCSAVASVRDQQVRVYSPVLWPVDPIQVVNSIHYPWFRLVCFLLHCGVSEL